MAAKIGVGVGAIVTHEGCLLMVRRAKDPGRGLWSVPGGHVESGEYLADALTREVKEETGLDVQVGELIGILELPSADHLMILDYHAIVLGDREPTPGDDVDEVRWVAFDDVADLECTALFHETLRGWGVLPTP